MSRQFRNGREDGLEPLEPMKIGGTGSFADLLNRMSKTAFGGRELGLAFQVLREMMEDSSATIVVTLSGAMTIAKMGRVLCEMIDAGMAHLIISTGALITHELTESLGGIHYKHNPQFSDENLYKQGYNRIYDTIELESNFLTVEKFVGSVLSEMDWKDPTCSYKINQALGRKMAEQGKIPSVLGNAYKKGIPIYIPAFTDSELGMNLATHFLAKGFRQGDEKEPNVLFRSLPPFNPFLDLYDFSKRMIASKTLGIFTIGGGVPRNWGQQVGPFIDSINSRLRLKLEPLRIRYGVRICPEPMNWGGLSGCTYSEGVSWGKFIPPREGGRFAEVRCDATIAWPILIRALLETRETAASQEHPSAS